MWVCMIGGVGVGMSIDVGIGMLVDVGMGMCGCGYGFVCRYVSFVKWWCV